jgi:anti-sigma factor RsiW
MSVRDDMVLHAALDGELDAMGMVEFERALASNPALAARHEQLVALRGAMRDHANDQRAPDVLRQKIALMADNGSIAAPAVVGARATPRWAFAAAILLAFIGGGIAMDLARRFAQQNPDRIAMLLVDDHRRALLAREPIDVASSDRHTVKPWFDARLALSPPVVDLASHGFTLVGGRADVVEGAPVPTIVYRLREHLVSVTALPATRFSATAAANVVNGYETISWTDGAFVYWAIGDLPRADLDTFVAAFKAAALTNVESR